MTGNISGLYTTTLHKMTGNILGLYITTLHNKTNVGDMNCMPKSTL